MVLVVVYGWGFCVWCLGIGGQSNFKIELGLSYFQVSKRVGVLKVVWWFWVGFCYRERLCRGCEQWFLYVSIRESFRLILFWVGVELRFIGKNFVVQRFFLGQSDYMEFFVGLVYEYRRVFILRYFFDFEQGFC